MRRLSLFDNFNLKRLLGVTKQATITLLATMMVLSGCAMPPTDGQEVNTPDSGISEEDNKVSGNFSIIVEVKGAEANRIIDDRMKDAQFSDADYEYAAEMTILGDDWIELRAHVPELLIVVNGEVAEINDKGDFTFDGLELRAGDLVEVSDGNDFNYFERAVTAEEAENKTLVLEDRVDFEKYLKKMELGDCCEDGSCPADKLRAASYSCLDNNGISLYSFIYSDCYMSLFHGPLWYSWMCWQELMDRYHDHIGNIWCNGTHNCSLFVHNWNWGCQNNGHRHYGYWYVGSGC